MLTRQTRIFSRTGNVQRFYGVPSSAKNKPPRCIFICRWFVIFIPSVDITVLSISVRPPVFHRSPFYSTSSASLFLLPKFSPCLRGTGPQLMYIQFFPLSFTQESCPPGVLAPTQAARWPCTRRPGTWCTRPPPPSSCSTSTTMTCTGVGTADLRCWIGWVIFLQVLVIFQICWWLRAQPKHRPLRGSPKNSGRGYPSQIYRIIRFLYAQAHLPSRRPTGALRTSAGSRATHTSLRPTPIS